MNQAGWEDFARRLMDRIEQRRPAPSVLAAIIGAELLDSKVVSSGPVAGEFAARMEARIHADGAVHLSSIVDEGLAFDGRAPEALPIGPEKIEELKRLWQAAFSKHGCAERHVGRDWFRSMYEQQWPAADPVYVGIDLASGPDVSVIVIRCDACGTSHPTCGRRTPLTYCETCGASFKALERG